ncbi:MAG: hypothetical protein ETSY1_05515 [Candidatus Entotheonella factor]|uniref:BioF2-like acetyltransferase domain-containing protein n=1 Tax=Entotheonella factor TaxID=1429438 RepID=W4LVI4_ENTF1|nr:MAG: hypothetical protein ETSY1_05515 [Candidatus Entotheonella factor]
MDYRAFDHTEVACKQWDAYVLQHPQAQHYHLSGWAQVIERAYGHRSVSLVAEDGEGEIKGVLPLIEMRRWVLGHVAASMPFLDYGGMCADEVSVRQGLLDAALAHCAQAGIKTLDLRHYTPSGLDLQPFDQKVTLVLPLLDEAGHLWKGLNAKVRNQVRKAEKSGLAFQWAGTEKLPDFYRVWSENMRDLGSPVHSLRFFRAVFACFPSTRLALVYAGDDVIGGAVCLYFRDTVLVPWASSLRSFFRYCPNNLLYWEAIRAACEAGYRRFDFGRSSYDTGTYRFKKQWGAVEHGLSWECWSAHEAARPIVEASHGPYGRAVQVWQRLPLPVANRLGPWIRRYLSN